ncbi:uncharacterized protein LOC128639960 [Bombina bombina]|uniref:uncharacterized protein LOC128639960 n=1 Tax=Bombina bombina TaxID=8345 RepID=UPI00235B2BDF|nr:uncharacterized protein LOC128639960 [Bombina bombina]
MPSRSRKIPKRFLTDDETLWKTRAIRAQKRLKLLEKKQEENQKKQETVLQQKAAVNPPERARGLDGNKRDKAGKVISGTRDKEGEVSTAAPQGMVVEADKEGQDGHHTQQKKHGRALRIWVVGHSYVYWAQVRAATLAKGTHLGFRYTEASVRWIGKRGMRWEELVSTIQQARQRWGRPDVMIIHLGGNDIGAYPLRELEESIKSVMGWLAITWQGVKIVWSNIISRLVWRNTDTQRAGYRARRKINLVAAKAVRGIGGSVLEHPLLAAKREEIFRHDGVHLNEAGNDQFLEDIRRMLEEMIKMQESSKDNYAERSQPEISREIGMVRGTMSAT